MRRILLAMTLSAVLPALSWAASSAGGPPVEGMPQLAFGHPVQGPLLIGQVVWQVIIFFALFLLLAFVALPRLGAVIDNRRQRIEADLEAARAAGRASASSSGLIASGWARRFPSISARGSCRPPRSPIRRCSSGRVRSAASTARRATWSTG